MATLTQKNATSRTPVEIWLVIFRFYLGPSQSDSNYNTIGSYARVFRASIISALREFSLAERKRLKLRLVCRAWRRVADILEERLVVSCLDGNDWPQSHRTDSASCVYYVPSDYLRHVAHIARWRARYQLPFAMNSTLIRFGVNASTARVLHISGMSVEIPDERGNKSIAASPTVEVLDWAICHRTEAVHGLAHPAFCRLVALKLTIDFPFPRLAATKHFQLPRLRYLYLTIDKSYVQSSHGGSFSSWRFPMLVMFQLWAKSASWPLWEETQDFLRAHAQTLEEISTTGLRRLSRNENSTNFAPLRKLWSEFHAIRLYGFSNLHEFADALPSIPDIWLNKSIKSSSRSRKFRVILGNAGLLADSAPVVTARLKEYCQTISCIDVVLETTWGSIMHPPDKTSHYWLQCVGVFFRVIDDVDLKVSDLNGEYSTCPTAMKIRSATERI
ncbi:hypothetical protein PIIN_09496 [Serendipita indica DSM 11827]|uniref:F-box domain-containing protein n=1 Tax=Serendipita indica (strain DSM 11827) TaxID=1109443 RepID=G4TW20_SERID|nr:hypothetical protein PIIN_09496 [Serendipita indica DSM 11827]